MRHISFFDPGHTALLICCHKLSWPAREVNLEDKNHDKRDNQGDNFLDIACLYCN